MNPMILLPVTRSAAIANSALLAAGFLTLSLAPLTAGPEGDFAQPLVTQPAADDGWEFSFTQHAWGPWVDITTSAGPEVHIGLDDLIENLDMILEFEVGVRKGKWGFTTDVIYYDGSIDLGAEAGRLSAGTFSLSEWILTPKLSYRVLEGDWGFLELNAGARYTWIKAKQDLKLELPLETRTTSLTVKKTVLDALVGFRGEYNITDRWYVPYYFDASSGDTDYTVQAFAAIGYRFEYADIFLGFRVLHYKFGDAIPALDTETGYGPQLGAKFTF